MNEKNKLDLKVIMCSIIGTVCLIVLITYSNMETNALISLGFLCGAMFAPLLDKIVYLIVKVLLKDY